MYDIEIGIGIEKGVYMYPNICIYIYMYIYNLHNMQYILNSFI